MLDRLIRLVIDVRHRFKDHHINDYSATLAFFWFLAIFPTFVLLFAVISWQMLSTGYSVYVDQFSMFGDTYGTIGIVILLQIWLYLTAATMLLGAEINAAWPTHMRRTRYQTHFP